MSVRRSIRRWLSAGALVAVLSAFVVAPAGIGPADAADGPFVPGSGAASSSVTKVRLFYAGYSIQVALGLSATTYENSQSRALGGAYDLSAVLGLVKQTVAELSPVSADSNSGDASIDRDLGAGPVLGRISLRATTVPAATAEVRLADVDLPGLVRVEGGHSRSSSAIVDGRTRRAEATVTVGTVSLLGGLVVLDGLHWDAVHQTGATSEADGTFALDRLLVAGAPIATDLHDLGPVLDAINAALGPVGLMLTAPTVEHRDNGAVEITGLRVGLLNSPLGADVLAPLIAGVRPLLVPVYEALTGADTTLGLAALVADLGLGVADGSGGLELSIGGATARTDATVYADPLSGQLPGSTGSGGGLASGGSATTDGLAAPAVAGSPGADAEVVRTSSQGPTRCVLAASPRRQGSCRGSNAPGAIAVVAVVAAAVGAHELRMRRRDVTAVPSGGPA
jgi:hypothetical protein